MKRDTRCLRDIGKGWACAEPAGHPGDCEPRGMSFEMTETGAVIHREASHDRR